MKALRLPSGLNTIENDAFRPHHISDIYFDGTEEEWNNNVTVGEMNNLGDDYVTMHFKSAHNHDFTGEIKNNGDGTHSYKCTGCETYGSSVAHEWDNGKVTTPATHLKKGVMTYTCACGETKTEPIEKLKEHDYTTVNVVDPTCTEQGYTEHKCACGDSYKDTYVVAKGHHYENGKCTSCGAADPGYSDGNQSTSCSCICHNNNRFVQFIYKIVRWFWEIFKIHKSCDCGNIHY